MSNVPNCGSDTRIQEGIRLVETRHATRLSQENFNI